MRLFKKKKEITAELIDDSMNTEITHLRTALNLLADKIELDGAAIYYCVTEHDIQLITLHEEFDYQCRLIELDFRGYFVNQYSKNTAKFQEMMVIPVLNEKETAIDHFFIQDFACRPNHGYGSIMMKVVLDYIKRFGADYVNGYLCTVDTKNTEHKNRLFHFYQKFGFTIGDVNDKGDYPIKLNLR